MIALGASSPLGGFLSAIIPFLELSVLPGKEMTVLVGDKAGGEDVAFLGGRPSLDGPGPRELRNDGVGAKCQVSLCGKLEDVQEAGYDLVFLRIFLLGDAFFFPLLFMIGSVLSARVLKQADTDDLLLPFLPDKLSLSESPFSLPPANGTGLDRSLLLVVILAFAAAVLAAPLRVDPPIPRQDAI
jgi:hypothetical protein